MFESSEENGGAAWAVDTDYTAHGLGFRRASAVACSAGAVNDIASGLLEHLRDYRDASADDATVAAFIDGLSCGLLRETNRWLSASLEACKRR